MTRRMFFLGRNFVSSLLYTLRRMYKYGFVHSVVDTDYFWHPVIANSS